MASELSEDCPSRVKNDARGSLEADLYVAKNVIPGCKTTPNVEGASTRNFTLTMTARVAINRKTVIAGVVLIPLPAKASSADQTVLR